MSWIDCINPFNNKVQHGFFRHIPTDKRFDNNDKAKICPICWEKAQRKNGTLPSYSSRNSASYINHLTESKPEKDTL